MVLNKSTTSSGFLSGFIESSVEMSPDGSNGECIVHYAGEHSKYELVVTLVGGAREGEAMLVNDGVPFLRLEFKQGSLTGVVERMNEYGLLDMRGHLVKGIESGLFVEFNRNKEVVWRGYYRNGVRYSEVKKSERLEGYYDEKSVESGALLSIAQYDDSLHDKNGRCMEYENGDWVGEWVYENGVRGRPIREYRNGTLTLYDDNGTKTFEGQYSKEEVNDGFYEHEPMEGMDGYCKEVDSKGRLIGIAEYDELKMRKNGRCFEMENGKVTRVCLYENGDMKRVMMGFNGSTMTEYDLSGLKAYEGGFKGDMKSGFMREGKGYEWDDNESMKRMCVYENGRVKQVVQEFSEDWMIEYDSDGKKVYEGEYKGDMKKGFVRNGHGYCLNVNGKDKQYCVYENGRLIRVVMELNGNEMIEFDDNGKRRYVGGFEGDMKNGFKRNGRGYCFDENEVMKQYCLFENGEMKEVPQEFDGSTMKEHNENGIVTYEGGFKGDMKSGFVREGKGKEYVVSKSSGTELTTDPKETLILIGSWENGKKNGVFFEVDVSGTVKRKLMYVNDEMKRVAIEFRGTTMIEFGEIGKREYEGEFKGDMESGFVREGKGKEFANGSRMAIYSGDWKNGKREGMGTEYKGFKPVYTGEWRNGKREGKGEEMDENGEVVRSGWWVDGIHESEITPILIPSSLTSNPQTIEELNIWCNSSSDSSVTEFKLIRVIHLKRIVIRGDCFGKVRVVELDSLMELESITIGEKSFTVSKDYEAINNSKRTDGTCRIVNCPKLKSIQIGYYSFADCHSFELINLPSLESIDIGYHCFYYASSFSLTG